MPMTPERRADLSRAAGYSYRQLKVFRDNRKAAVKQYVGTHYSENGAEYKVPIPMIELAINIYLQLLVASSPVVAVNTGIPKLKELVDRFKLALNHLITEEIDLEDTLESAVVGAIFSVGIVKVALNRTQVEYMGTMFDAGQAFAAYVNMDNWIHDMSTDNLRLCQFFADKYPISVEDAKKIYPDKEDSFVPTSQTFTDNDTVHAITDNSGDRTEFNATMLVWDCYLPRENKVVTFMDTGDPGNPFGEELGEVEWYGVETGPYHILGFNKVEGNTMPLAPVALWMDLDSLINKLYRKLGRQAERQKTNTFVSTSNKGDAKTLKNANDGEILAVDNADKIGDRKTGGIDPTNLAFMIQSKDLLDDLAGNLSSLGGLAPQSDTLGQDTLLSVGASQRIKRMNKKVYKFVRGICKALGFYLWTDPFKITPVVKKLPGMEEIQVHDTFGRNDIREEDAFSKLDLNIEPYSLQHQGPEQKLQSLRTIFMEIISPMLPNLAQMGIGFDFEKFLRTIGELANLPELDNLLVYADPKHLPQIGGGEAPGKPANTNRTYTRVNRPGATQQGKDSALMQTLLGGRPQGSEMAALNRSSA